MSNFIFTLWTHVIPAELQHGSDQSELLVDLLALEVREDLLEAVADAVHGHVPAEDDAEGEHVKKDTSLHWQLLVARRRLLLGHAVFEGGVVEVHFINLAGQRETLMKPSKYKSISVNTSTINTINQTHRRNVVFS